MRNPFFVAESQRGLHEPVLDSPDVELLLFFAEHNEVGGPATHSDAEVAVFFASELCGSDV
jgi:hypothetical protein